MCSRTSKSGLLIVHPSSPSILKDQFLFLLDANGMYRYVCPPKALNGIRMLLQIVLGNGDLLTIGVPLLLLLGIAKGRLRLLDFGFGFSESESEFLRKLQIQKTKT